MANKKASYVLLEEAIHGVLLCELKQNSCVGQVTGNTFVQSACGSFKLMKIALLVLYYLRVTILNMKSCCMPHE